MSAPKKKKYPLEIKVGNTTVTIYKGESGGREFFTLAYQDGPRRAREGFRNEGKAIGRAEQVAAKLESGHRTAAAMKTSDAEAFGLAMVELAQLGERKVPLNVAVKEYVQAVKLLNGGSLIEAAKFYAARRPTLATTISVSDAVEEFILAKKSDGVGNRYLQDARSRLRRFGKAFSAPLASLTSDLMEKWLRATATNARTRNNFRQHVVTLFRWARDRGYLPREAQTEADRLPLAKDRGGDVKCFSPDAVAKLLANADDTLRPYLAIRAFAGVRDSEMRRLTWENVRFDQGVIEIRAAQAKTASRRLIPIQPNLERWLAPYRTEKGRIGYFNSERMSRVLAKVLGIPWVHNGLRHGFGSHRLAVTKNAAEVAHEMGNTERMVHAHYKELVTEKQGKAWFAIVPKKPANAVGMKEEAA